MLETLSSSLAFRPWIDAFGRAARALRVSVTDRCNLRCVYCMPAVPSWLPAADILGYEELARLCSVAVRCGIEKIRVTGGEPLARPKLHVFASMLRELPGLRELTLTTNGIGLAAQARALAQAGVDRVTVSLDTLQQERFEAIARRPGFSQVLRGMDAAERAGFRLKVNMVVMRGYNEDEIPALADWGRRHGREVRFIEFMPLEGDHIWNHNRVVSADEILRRVAQRFPLRERPGQRAGATAVMYDYLDGNGSVGIIASVTRAFCAQCDRVRITVDGGFRTCLFSTEGRDLRGPLRGGADDEELAGLMRNAVERKSAGHLINLPGFKRPDRAMNAIGG